MEEHSASAGSGDAWWPAGGELDQDQWGGQWGEPPADSWGSAGGGEEAGTVSAIGGTSWLFSISEDSLAAEFATVSLSGAPAAVEAPPGLVGHVSRGVGVAHEWVDLLVDSGSTSTCCGWTFGLS